MWHLDGGSAASVITAPQFLPVKELGQFIVFQSSHIGQVFYCLGATGVGCVALVMVAAVFG